MKYLFLIVSTSCFAQSLWVNKASGIDATEKDSIFLFKEAYLQLKLSSVTKETGRYYLALHQIKPFNITTGSVTLIVVNNQKDKTAKKFTDGIEFLNYLDACGYDMVSETKNKYGGEYTFKKKKP